MKKARNTRGDGVDKVPFMGVNALSGQTVPATDRRNDFQGAQHQARINPGLGRNVPKSGVRTGRQGLNDADRQWRRQERMQHASGHATHRRANDWNSFLGGGRPQSRDLGGGSVEIDRGNAQQVTNSSVKAAKAKLADDKSTGWERTDAAYSMATQFDETQQDKKSFLDKLRGPGLLGFSVFGK